MLTKTNVKQAIRVCRFKRTDLIAHPMWGLQFSFSYDFSSASGTRPSD